MNSNSTIIPAILESSFEEVKKKMAMVEGRVPWVQLDICDGMFAGPATWRDPQLLSDIDGAVKAEVHLMIENPEREVPAWRDVADRIIVHYESTNVLGDIIDGMHGFASQLGVALMMDTPLDVLYPYKRSLTHVQLMGIAEIGVQGHALDERIYERVRELREHMSDVTISIDGGVTLDNISALYDAGARCFVVGSALFKQVDFVTALAAMQEKAHGASTR